MTKYAEPLLFLRHGATRWNLQGRYQGVQDTSLSSTGLADAQRAASLLHKLTTSRNICRNQITLVSSPLKRAQQTAEVLSRSWKPALPISTVKDFRELSMGQWEGLTSMEVKQRHYEERKSRKLDRWNFSPVGGESMAQRCPGIEKALCDLPPNSVVITHSVVMRVIFHLLGHTPKEVASVEKIPHGSIWCWNSAKMHRQD